MTADADAAPLVVATWNVHGFVGRDGAHDPGRTLRVLQELDADVVALQEVVSPDGEDPLDAIARRLGVEPVRGPTLERRAGLYGNAILTRLPVRRVRRIDLSVPGREPRGALDCILDAGLAPLRVLATHLGLRARERRLQAVRLAAEIERPAPPALVLLGDLNEWRRFRDPLAPLRALLGPSKRPRTFPAWRPALPLDRIWARPPGLLRDVAAHPSRLARDASDHLPVRGELLLQRVAPPRVSTSSATSPAAEAG